MPDFRKQIEEANFRPDYANDAVDGPGDTSPPQDWTHDVLTQSSAEELANLLGAKLVETKWEGGPFQPEHRQWQLDFGPGDDFDASLVYDQYRRAPSAEHFNAQRLAEMNNPGPVGPVGSAPTTPVPGPGGPVGPPPGPGVLPYPPGSTGGTGTVPGPTWPNVPPPNQPGPIWNPPPLPPMPEAPAVTPFPGTGVKPGGGFTVPPMFTGQFPSPIPLPLQEPDYRQIPGLLALTLGRKQNMGGLLG